MSSGRQLARGQRLTTNRSTSDHNSAESCDTSPATRQQRTGLYVYLDELQPNDGHSSKSYQARGFAYIKRPPNSPADRQQRRRPQQQAHYGPVMQSQPNRRRTNYYYPANQYDLRHRHYHHANTDSRPPNLEEEEEQPNPGNTFLNPSDSYNNFYTFIAYNEANSSSITTRAHSRAHPSLLYPQTRPTGSLDSFGGSSLENSASTGRLASVRAHYEAERLNRDNQRHYHILDQPTARLNRLRDSQHTMRAPTANSYRPSAATILHAPVETSTKSHHQAQSAATLITPKVKSQASSSSHGSSVRLEPSSQPASNMSRGPGGQRTALKLVTGPAPTRSVSPSPPRDCCTQTASSATTSSAVSISVSLPGQQQQLPAIGNQLATSQQPPPPPPNSNVPPPPPPQQPQSWAQQQSYGSPYAIHHQHRLIGDSCISDPELSDCSCSNSMDCLPLSQHSASNALVLAAQMSPQHQHQHRIPTHYVHHHHHPQLHLAGANPNNYHHHQAHQNGMNQQPPRHHPTGAPPSLAQVSLPVPPPPPAPPPLVRHNTYTATSETITDASLMGGPQMLALGPQHSVMVGTPRDSFNDPANEANCGGHERQDADLSLRATNSADIRQHLTNGTGSASRDRHRQTVSFRRSTTATSAADHKGTTQMYAQSVQLHGAGQQASGSPHSRLHSGNQQQQQQCNTSPLVSNGLASGGSLQRPHSSSSHNRYQQQQQLAANFGGSALNATYSPFSPLPLGGATQPPLVRAISTGSAAAATTTQMPLLFDPSACPPLPPITSHRTNSPWMRISSIILTPIGMVIILFIVVSPLLHYLM